MDNISIHIPPEKTEPLIIGKQVFRSFYDWTLTEKDLERARLELGESEERKEVCLRELKEKILNDGNVKFRLDDSYLLRFLRVRKFDVLEAYQKVKNFYDMRKKHSDFLTISPNLKSLQELNYVTFLPYTDEEGRALVLFNFEKWNPYENTFEEMIQSVTNVADIAFMNPKCQINGVVFINDFNGFSFKHVSELLWNGRLWTLLKFSQNGNPLRIKKSICLHTNQFVQYLYNILEPFVERKLTERVVLLGSDINELHRHVSPVLLPKRLNGILEEEECNMSQFILDNMDYIRYERSFLE